MELPGVDKERLIVPTDFTKTNVQDDLVPPSHFASTVSSTGAQRSAGGKMPGTAAPINWTKPSIISLQTPDQSHSNCLVAIAQTQEEILKLKKVNQRLIMQQGEHLCINKARDCNARNEQCYLEGEDYKAEAERLKGQVQTLKEAAIAHREETRDKDMLLNRRTHELEVVREELHRTKAELGLVKKELSQIKVLKQELSSKFDHLNRKSNEEIQKLNRDLQISREEAKSWSLKADKCKLEAEDVSKWQTQRLSIQLEELQKNHETEMERLTASHSAELQETSRKNRELQDRSQIMSSEVLQLKRSLTEVLTENDRLKDHLSQTRQAFEMQSTTLHSLRNYIGQLTPESGEKDRLNEAVERLNREKLALQTTAELLTIRFNSLNEILTLQEEQIIKKNFTDSIVKNGSESVHVLRLWRENVFKLYVQLGTKDIEMRAEKHELLSQVNAIKQQLQQEQQGCSVLRLSLDDKTAALALEQVEKETLKQDLDHTLKENSQLMLQTEEDQKDLKYLSEAVYRLSLFFEAKVSEIDAAQTKLNMSAQRLSFANRRVETIQGLIMRRAALQKVKQSSKQAQQAADCISSLQTQLHLVSEERDKLTLELKQTPDMIEKALSDLKEQYEGRLMQVQQALEQTVLDMQEAVSDRDQAQRRVELIQDQLQQSEVKLEHLSSELLSQQESSQRALEIEERCAAEMNEMRDQVNRARAEHTRAVMMLRRFEKQATKNKAQVQREHAQKEDQKAVQYCPALWEQRETTSQTPVMRPKVQLPADAKLLSVLEELQSLSAAVLNSSEDSAEEDGQAAEDNIMKASHRNGHSGDAAEE